MSPLRNHTASCEKRQNHFDLAVRDLSPLLNRLCVTPRTKPRRMKPLGVACGKMRYSRVGARRKMFIDVNRKKDSRHTARGIPSHSSSFLYVQSKFEESHREPGKKTLRSTRRRNPSLSSRGFVLSASRRPKSSNVVNGNESDKRQISRVPLPESELPQSPTRSSYRGTLTSVSSEKSEQSQCYEAKSSVPCPLVASREIVSPNDDAPGPSFTPDRNLASRGPSGSPTGGTTRQRSHRGQSSHRTNLEFTAYMNKRVIAKIAGGRWVEGTLRGYDSYMNLVLEDTVELRSTGERIPVGVAVIRGRSIAMVEEAAEGVSADVIIHRSGFHERKPLKTIQLDEE